MQILNFSANSLALDLRYNAGLSFSSNNAADALSFSPSGGTFDEIMRQKLDEARREPVSPDKVPEAETAARPEQNENNQQKELSVDKSANGSGGKEKTAVDEKAKNQEKRPAALSKNSDDGKKDDEASKADKFTQNAELTFAVNINAEETAPQELLPFEEGIDFTDTLPLHENKPEQLYSGLENLLEEKNGAAENEIEIASLQNNKVRKEETKEKAAKNISEAPENSGGKEETPIDALFEAEIAQVKEEKPAAALNAVKEDGAKKKGDTKKLSIEVTDARTVDAGAQSKTAEAPLRDTQLRAETAPVKDIIVELHAGGGADSRPVSFEQFRNTGVKSAEQLSSFLTRELHNNLNGDIVRHASVMLRDGGEGLIRLRLHPESLGNVNVRLSLSGNKVEGIITVESAEAYNAFESEKQALETAFRESGFDSANLNMQFAGGRQNGNDEKSGAFLRSVSASLYESRTITSGMSGENKAYAHEGLSILA